MKIFIKVSNLWGVIYIFLSVFALNNSTFFLVLEYWVLEIWGMCYLLNIYLWFSVMAPNFNWMAIFHINLHLEKKVLQNYLKNIFNDLLCVCVWFSIYFFKICWILFWIVTLPTSFFLFSFFCLKDNHTKCRIKNRALYNDLIIAC